MESRDRSTQVRLPFLIPDTHMSADLIGAVPALSVLLFSRCSSESLQPRLAYLARDVPARAAVRQQQRSKHRGEERRANLGLRPLVEQDLPHGGKHELTAEHAARVRNDGRVGILRSFLRRLRRKK